MKQSFALLTLFLSLALLAQAAETADESKILALENAWNQAQLQHDERAVSQLLSENFVYTDTDGEVMNRARFLEDLKDPAFVAALITNEDVKVYSYKGAAIVAGTYHTKGKYKGKAFDHWGRFTDTWVYQDNTWVCVASHTTLIKNKSKAAE